MQGKLRTLYVSLQWKLLIPFLVMTLVILFLLLPITNRRLGRVLERDADRQLAETAESANQLLIQAEDNALIRANFVANLSEVEIAAERPTTTALDRILNPRRATLGVQEISFYTPDYQSGGQPFFYGGPSINELIRVRQYSQLIRDRLIKDTFATGEPQSGIAINPEFSSAISTAPVINNNQVKGVILTAIYLNDSFIAPISQILNADIALVKDNKVITTTIDPKTGYKTAIESAFIDPSGKITTQTITGEDDKQYRLLAYPLLLDNEQEGTILVSRSIDEQLEVERNLQNALLMFVVVVVVMTFVFGVGTFFNFSRPLKRLTQATHQVSAGDLEQRVSIPHFFARDEISELSENFNLMAMRLQDLYGNLEQRVEQRTHELLEERNKLNMALNELAIARDEALAANRSKSVFLANMSHELRTPLNAIIGYSNLVLSGTYGPTTELQIDRLKRVADNGSHLLNLINDVLDLSKIEAGRMELYLETFDVRELIESAVESARPLVLKNNNTLQINVPDTVGKMKADATKVRQVIFNLLSNAAKFTEDGLILLTATPLTLNGEAWMEFQVQDNGIGMSEDTLGKLFKEFMQADSSTTRKYGGTGLGLAISRRFCEMMGGEMWAESEEGKGSIFTMRLPVTVIQPEERQPEEPEPIPTYHTPLSEGELVLVIDDDATIRDLMTHYLREEGYKVLTTASGEEGLRLAKAHKPSMITLDVMMPQMDGWGVLAMLKADPELADIPVIMVTIIDNKKMGYALGASEYLTKPIKPERLKEVLQKYCVQPPCPILVVEDDDSTRLMLSDMLKQEGWEVHEAENGRIGLEQMEKHQPQLVILDLMMPEMDGFEFIEAVRNHSEWRNVPVVVVTAMNLSPQDRQKLNGYVQRILQKGAYDQESLLKEIAKQIKATLGYRAVEKT